MTDREILALYRARDEAAIGCTRDKFGAFLRQLAWNILRSPEDADECENDTYLAAWEHIPPAEPMPMKPYLGQIVRNLALQKYRWYSADKRSRSLEASFDELSECVGAAGEISEQLDLQQLGACIDAFLRTISPEARVMFLRRYYLAETVEEVASALRISRSKVKSSLFRTRSGLRECLRKEGYAV
jgi:RNA polymerase sigma-70 factor (ECF subfamily)